MPIDKSVLTTRFGNTVDWAVAYAFGIVANLAYYPADSDRDNRWAAHFGFTDSELIVTPTNVVPNYVRIRSADAAIFGISGTVNLPQMINNVTFSDQIEDTSFGQGKIHSFFRWCANGLIPYIQADLAGKPTQIKVCFTGHSLGGAVAQLLADWFYINTAYDICNCMVFNAPKVGDSDWANRSRPYNFYHICHNEDLVRSLPTPYSVGLGTPVGGDTVRITEWKQRRPMVGLSRTFQNADPDYST